MKNLTWIACNGVKPDLPDGTMGKRIWRTRNGEVDVGIEFKDFSKLVEWSNIIAYALEPKDPVRELASAIRIEIHRNETSLPIVYEDALNSYTKGNMYCVLVGDSVHKYPLSGLFRVIEEKEKSRRTK